MSVENLNDIQDMRPRLKPRLMSLSQDHITTFDMGWLVPHRTEYLVPGDKVNIGHSCFFRFDPFMNPILSRANGKNYDFMIPERILYNETEYDKWFTGGVNGADEDKLKPHLSLNVLYDFAYKLFGPAFASSEGGAFGFNSLADYLGFPVNQFYVPAVVDPDSGTITTPAHFMDPTDVKATDPILLERFLAYALVYREYFLWNHNENSLWVQNPYLSDFTKIPFGNLDAMLDSQDSAYDHDFEVFLGVILQLQRKGWSHDYFTSALPNIQSGDPAAMTFGSASTIEGNLNPVTIPNVNIDLLDSYEPFYIQRKNATESPTVGWRGQPFNLYTSNNGAGLKLVQNGELVDGEDLSVDSPIYHMIAPHSTLTTRFNTPIKITDINGQSSGFTINDLRLLNAIQVYKERLNVGGTRLKEALYMQFGVTVPDDRLDRPDFVGFMDFPVQISEVLQTSQTTSDSVLGDQGGHGIGAASQQTVFNYFVLEPMIHLSVMAVLPDTYYMQGLDPFWSKVSRYDVWNPVFNHLSDQAVSNRELYFRPTQASESEFGYLPRFAEYKATYNRISGNLRKIDSGYMSWHQGRLFSELPLLNQTFIDSHPTERIFAVVDNDEESGDPNRTLDDHTHVIGVINNQMKIARNVPSGSDPSLNID